MERLIRNFELMEEFEEIETVANQRVPRVTFTDRQDPFSVFNDEVFQNKFLWTKHQFLIVLQKFKDKLASSMSHSPLLQFIVFMHYVRSNGFLSDVSTQSFVQLPTSTVHQIVNSVAKDIASYSRTYIVYPNIEEQNITAARILAKYNFPGCSKVLDGCQICIRLQSSQMWDLENDLLQDSHL